MKPANPSINEHKPKVGNKWPFREKRWAGHAAMRAGPTTPSSRAPMWSAQTAASWCVLIMFAAHADRTRAGKSSKPARR